MRTREEIQDIDKMARGTVSSIQSSLLLEVLLDIRDLLLLTKP